MVMGGPNPGIWYVCESIGLNGKKCGHQVEVHIIGEPPDELILKHAPPPGQGGCSGTMRRKGL